MRASLGVSLALFVHAGPVKAVCDQFSLVNTVKVYRVGGECVPVEFDPVSGFATPVATVRGDDSSIMNHNQTPGSAFFVCPLENDRGLSQLGFFSFGCADEARIYVLDRHHTLDVECVLSSTDPYGLTWTSTLPMSSSGASATAQALTFLSFVPSADHWYFLCEVPNRGVDPRTGGPGEFSGITGYFIHELDAVDFTDDYEL